MSKFFNANNPIWQIVGKLFDAIILHIFWLLCSLPIVTFGASTVALYDIMMKLAKDETGHYYRKFYQSFKANLKQGIVLGLIFLLTEGAMLYAFLLCIRLEGLSPVFPGLKIVLTILMVLVLITFEYAFPLLARFDNTIRRTIQNGFLLSLRHIGWTIVMTVILVGFYALIFLLEQYLFPFLIMGFGLIAFLQSYILNHIFQPFITAQEAETEAASDSLGNETEGGRLPEAQETMETTVHPEEHKIAETAGLSEEPGAAETPIEHLTP